MIILKRIGKELNLMVLIPHPLNISVLILLVEDAVRHERVRVQLRRIERRAHTLATLYLKIPQVNLNYNQFFKKVATYINNICTSLINHFAKFNLVSKCFYLVKDKNLQTL